MIDFLKPPMFSEPDKTCLPLAKFSAGDPVKLEQEIHDATAELNLKAKDFSSSKSFSEEYLELIGQAEAHTAKKQWAEAHRAIWEATFLVSRALESRASGKFRKCIGWYLALWLLMLGLAGWWLKNYEGQAVAEPFFGFSYWRYLLMGALGGITIAIWGLIVHTANLDFDRHFAVWYWFKPLLGAVMGLVAVVAVQAGLFAIEGQPALKGKMALYLLAFLAGFSERFFIRVIDRVMTAMFSSGQSPPSSSKPTAPKASASG